MKVVRKVAEVRAAVAGSDPVGLVPTMGAFHAGHRALFDAARGENAVVVVSLFVNPAQFSDAADLRAYPRDEARDLALADEAGVDVVFAPAVEEIYPPGFQMWVDVGDVARGGEGSARPGHFRAVATVCLKLFTIVRPQRVYFGQKDAQQAAVIDRLVRDLELDLAVRIVPTVRDDDGLALSSRNVRLSADERARALGVPRALQAAVGSPDPVSTARALMNGLDPEYVEVLQLRGAKVLTAAARVGPIRLIDNVILEGELS